MNNAKAFQAAQRSYDNALPEEAREEVERFCRVCSEWLAENLFATPRAHVCIACDEWAAGLEVEP